MRYKIVLYNAGKRIKCFGTFRKYTEANEFYQLNLLNNKVYFPRLSQWDGAESDYELVLLGPPEGKHVGHIKAEDGRNITLKAPDGHTVKKLEPYYVEEKFLHKNKDAKMNFKEFVKRFIANKNGGKIFHTVNNKLVIERFDSDDLDVFTLKNEADAVRLNDTIRAFCHANSIYDHMYFTTPTAEMKSLIYNMVEERLGIPREYMWRQATR